MPPKPKPKPKAKAKKAKGKMPAHLQFWRTAALEHGYGIKGQFKQFPKKGTPEHTKVKARADELKKEAEDSKGKN